MALDPHKVIAGERESPQDEDCQGSGNPDSQAKLRTVLHPDLPDMAVHGFGIDTPRAANAPQVGKQPLQAWSHFACVGISFLESQPFEGKPWTRKTLRDTILGFVIGEHNDFNARIEQHRDDIALQEVNDCHAVVGGDKNLFGH